MRIAIRGGIATAIGNMALMIANLGRDVSISRVLGVSTKSDAVFLALSLPVFVVMVTTIGFRNASLPFVERVKQAGGNSEAAKCVAHLVLLALFGFASLALVLAAAAPTAATWFQGFSFDVSAVIHVLVMSLPMFVVSAVAMMLEGPLQANGRFLVPALLKALMPLGFAIGLVSGARRDPVMWALVGGHIGAVTQCVLTAWLVRQAELAAPVHLRLKHEELPLFRAQYGYLVLAGCIAYLNPLINQWMATPLGTGAVSTLSYATRLSAGVATLAVSSITPALLAQFSRSAASGKPQELAAVYRKACIWMIGISGAGVLCTWMLAAPVVRILYQGDAVDPQEAHEIIWFLCISILQLVPLSLGACAGAMLSATSHNRMFASVAALLVVVNITGNFIFIHFFGLTGMAISTIAMYCCSMVLMNAFLLRKRIIVLRGA